MLGAEAGELQENSPSRLSTVLAKVHWIEGDISVACGIFGFLVSKQRNLP